MLSTQQFERIRQLALDLAGIELLERHREVLQRRSGRHGILDGALLDSLLSAAERGDSVATQKLLALLTTKFTGFFRHPGHFDIAAKHVLEAVEHKDEVRCWCAAAATGEEPYSLAMALVEAFDGEDPPVHILATDIDVHALEVARQADYAESALRALEPRRRARFLTQPGVPRRWRIAPAVRRLVEFRELNLAGADWPVEGPLDVIFCRNVLMYLESSRRQAALERMASLLAMGGFLIVDPSEHLGAAESLFVPGTMGVYALRGTCPTGRSHRLEPIKTKL